MSADELDDYFHDPSDDSGPIRVDPSLLNPKTRNSHARHPFGLRNSPQVAWAALGRLRLGEGNSDDRDLVDTFSDDMSYFGDAVGGHEWACRQRRKIRLATKRRKSSRRNIG